MAGVYGQINQIAASLQTAIGDQWHDSATAMNMYDSVIGMLTGNQNLVWDNAQTMKVEVVGGFLDEIVSSIGIDSFADLLNLTDAQKAELVGMAADGSLSLAELLSINGLSEAQREALANMYSTLNTETSTDASLIDLGSYIGDTPTSGLRGAIAEYNNTIAKMVGTDTALELSDFAGQLTNDSTLRAMYNLLGGLKADGGALQKTDIESYAGLLSSAKHMAPGSSDLIDYFVQQAHGGMSLDDLLQIARGTTYGEGENDLADEITSAIRLAGFDSSGLQTQVSTARDTQEGYVGTGQNASLSDIAQGYYIRRASDGAMLELDWVVQQFQQQGLSSSYIQNLLGSHQLYSWGDTVESTAARAADRAAALTSITDWIKTSTAGMSATELSLFDAMYLGKNENGADGLRGAWWAEFGELAPFKHGGHTGWAMSDDRVMGITHANEWVSPAWMTRSPEYGPIIEQLESARTRGFKSGGYTSGAPIGGFSGKDIEEIRKTNRLLEEQNKKLEASNNYMKKILDETERTRKGVWLNEAHLEAIANG
jgi:hypothetical protein